MSDIIFDFKGKNFIVVGASSGMGKQITLELAQAGAKVMAVARNKERLKELQQQFPSNVQSFSLDVLQATATDWESLIAEFVVANGKISGAVYTAGIAGNTPLRMYDEVLAQDIVNTSFWGLAHFLQVCTRKKYALRGASFVAFSSVAGKFGNEGKFAYSAAKAAVSTAIKSWAKELSRNAQRINCVSPGWVVTPMTQDATTEQGRSAEAIGYHCLGWGRADNVSGMVLFLLCDRASWITGTDVIVDGGYLLGKD